MNFVRGSGKAGFNSNEPIMDKRSDKNYLGSDLGVSESRLKKFLASQGLHFLKCSLFCLKPLPLYCFIFTCLPLANKFKKRKIYPLISFRLKSIQLLTALSLSTHLKGVYTSLDHLLTSLICSTVSLLPISLIFPSQFHFFYPSNFLRQILLCFLTS